MPKKYVERENQKTRKSGCPAAFAQKGEKGVRFMRRAESHAPHEVRSRTAEKRGGRSKPADLYVIDK
ncbi:hypothetical protein [uncultured Cloacibacillus sp.]|uniref:hypothetical protein n=1 Tax=uncultured Cloacibacillus sp. TaxID=889794 RepID=UPI00320BA6D5